ncbi:cytochrome P450 4d8-like [Teleopsis dalmanni]|uniref:cytochrome P450 4d8-like n=1 Tax=Teleopsis dalmanni TaxID=139649 RepID=UPI000D32CC1F|nr:cytochrome P450 4d8-like [Teleopsis dalmanni]
MFLITFIVLLFVTLLISYVSNRKRRQLVKNISGPFNVPGIGSISMFIKINPKNFFKVSKEFHDKFGKIICAWAFNRLVIVSSDLELNEQIFASNQHISKQRNYSILHQWLGTGLLMSDGKKWFSRRKIITPAFHFKILEEFVDVFDQQSNILLERLTEKADGKTEFDVYPFICLAALDIIAETAMGTKVNAQTNSGSEYASAVNEVTKLMSWRFMKITFQNEFLFTLLCPLLKLRQMKLIKIMHAFTIGVIEERRRNLEGSLTKQTKTNIESTEEEPLGKKKRNALLDVLLQSTIDGKPLTNENIREEVDTFMFEGHDTTTSAIGFALHLIARHPHVQQKMLDEVLQVLGNKYDEPITQRHLNDLKYTEYVIKESLRMYPSVPMIGREIKEDFKYTHSKRGDGVIPAGTELFIAIYGILHDPENFENPSEFIPERHENSSVNSAFSMVPFSAGPRNCIGQKFAMLEMKMILAKIVRSFELLPLGQVVEPELNIVMRSSTGFQIGLKKRT